MSQRHAGLAAEEDGTAPQNRRPREWEAAYSEPPSPFAAAFLAQLMTQTRERRAAGDRHAAPAPVRRSAQASYGRTDPGAPIRIDRTA